MASYFGLGEEYRGRNVPKESGVFVIPMFERKVNLIRNPKRVLDNPSKVP